jgi:hypothetical protein
VREKRLLEGWVRKGPLDMAVGNVVGPPVGIIGGTILVALPDGKAMSAGGGEDRDQTEAFRFGGTPGMKGLAADTVAKARLAFENGDAQARARQRRG